MRRPKIKFNESQERYYLCHPGYTEHHSTDCVTYQCVDEYWTTEHPESFISWLTDEEVEKLRKQYKEEDKRAAFLADQARREAEERNSFMEKLRLYYSHRAKPGDPTLCELTCDIAYEQRWSHYQHRNENKCPLTCDVSDEYERNYFYSDHHIACDINKPSWRKAEAPGFSVDKNGYPLPLLPDHTEESLRKLKLDAITDLVHQLNVNSRSCTFPYNNKKPWINYYLNNYKQENEKRMHAKNIMAKHNVATWTYYIETKTAEDFWK
jgi:hypothetical protein